MPRSQLTEGNRTWNRLFQDTGPSVQFINMHGFTVVNASTAVKVTLLRTITRPHIIRTFQPVINTTPGQDLAIDILISRDTLIDTEAEIRDDHLSGGRLATDGFAASAYAQPWKIDRKISQWFTTYKLAMRNMTIATYTFDVNLTIETI